MGGAHDSRVCVNQNFRSQRQFQGVSRNFKELRPIRWEVRIIYKYSYYYSSVCVCQVTSGCTIHHAFLCPATDLAINLAINIAIDSAPDLAIYLAIDIAIDSAPDLAIYLAIYLAIDSAPDLAIYLAIYLAIDSAPDLAINTAIDPAIDLAINQAAFVSRHVFISLCI